MKKLIIFTGILFAISCSKDEHATKQKKETVEVVIQIEEVTKDGNIYTLKPEKFTYIRK